jgi:hypothetical protein
LYYARAVDPTVLIPLNDIYTYQTRSTGKTQAAANPLLECLATFPDATIRYHKLDMILHIQSDASYLSVSNARIRLGDLFYCGNKTQQADKLNGSILNEASVIKKIVESAAESEVGECFQNAQSGVPLRVTLIELGHQQPATPLRTDNSTVFGILNEKIKQKRSKAMDIRYKWLTDIVRQKEFNVCWCPGKDNIGDYRTKHNPAQHHKDKRPLILHQANGLSFLRGCTKLPQPAAPAVHAHIHTDMQTRPENHSGKSIPISCVCYYIP